MKLLGCRVVFLLDHEFEDLEHYVPLMRLQEEGARVVVAAKTRGTYTGKGGLNAEATLAFAALRPEDFDACVVPGGWSPDKVRRDAHALGFLQTLDAQDKVLAFICHAGWVASSAGLVRAGHAVTGSLGIRDDMLAKGAVWRDEAAFCEGHLVWGRVVADIPAFCRELVAALTRQHTPKATTTSVG